MIGPRDPGAPHPCLEHACDACCHGTELGLLDEDLARLEAAGHRGFCRMDGEGYLRLRNRDGHCVFLARGRCTVYPIRPDGCRLYPAVYWVEEDHVAADDFCPHRDEFRITPGLALLVLRGVWLDDRQALLRRRLAAGRRNIETASQVAPDGGRP